jgi:predicted ArsR family transcriptional regulator
MPTRTTAARSIGPRQPHRGTKQGAVLALLRRPEGATVAQIAEATGWANHTVRGFFAGLKKRQGIVAEAQERVRQVGPNPTSRAPRAATRSTASPRSVVLDSRNRGPRYAVALYRVSTTEQGQSGLGLEAQRASVRAFATAQGWTLVAEYSDIASGKDDRRPGFQAALGGDRGIGQPVAPTPQRPTRRWPGR